MKNLSELSPDTLICNENCEVIMSVEDYLTTPFAGNIFTVEKVTMQFSLAAILNNYTEEMHEDWTEDVCHSILPEDRDMIETIMQQAFDINPLFYPDELITIDIDLREV